MSRDKAKDAAGGVQTRCPICGAPAAADYQPFCSRRCADVDLSRWLRGAYAIPGGGSDEDEDGDEAAAGRGGSEPPDGERG